MALLGVGQSVWATSTTSSAGATNNSTAWNTWDAGFTKNYTLSGNGSIKFRFYATNSTSQAYYGWTLFVGNTINTTNVWDSWMNCRAGDAGVWGTRSAAKGSAAVTNNYATNNPSGSGITTAINGAMVSLTVTRSYETIVASADITPASENPFNITWTYTYGDGDDSAADLYLSFAVDNAYLNITSVRNIAEDFAIVDILSEDYEEYTIGDITATMASNGWTFQSKNNKNEVKIVQGTGSNVSKYFDFYYPDGGANRNQYWILPASALSALTANNWTLTFSAAFNPGTNNSSNRFDILGSESRDYNSAYNSATNTLLNLTGTAAAASTYTVAVGATTVKDSENPITLASGTWYKFTIKASNINTESNTADIYVKITSFDETTTVLETTQASMSTLSIGSTLKGLCWNSPRGYSRLSLDDVTLTKDISTATCADPTWAITGASGTSRKFTLDCESGGSTIYYSSTELAAGADGWTEYTGEVTTAATTIYAYAATASANSNVVNFSTGAGKEVQLATPVITRNAYNTVTITADQSSLGFDVLPVPTIYYTYGGAATKYEDAITVSADNTITAYAVLDGYTTSETVSRAVALYPQTQIENAPENNDYSSAELSGSTFTTEKATYDALILDGKQWGNNVYVQTTDFKWRNGGSSYHWYINSTSSTWLCVKNMKANEVIVCKTDYAASSLVNATYSEKYSYGNNIAYVVTNNGDVEIGFAKPDSKTMNYFYGIYAYSDNYASVTVSGAGFATYVNSAYDLDFSTTEIEAYKVKVSEKGVATLTKVDNVPARTPVLLYKEGGATESIPVMTGAAAVSDNDLVAGNDAAVATTDGDYTNMILNVIDDKVGFYFANDKTVAANRAYLHILTTLAPDAAAGSRMMMVFDDEEVTGIKSIDHSQLRGGDYYNLSGQRVAKAQKGLYIVNGKKVVIK